MLLNHIFIRNHKTLFRLCSALLLLFLVACACAQKSNAIILIQPGAVSRVIRPENYNHGLWIRWPNSTNPSGTNRLLSPITGYDWRLSGDPFAQSPGSKIPRIVGLEEIGVLNARKNWMDSTEAVVLLASTGFPHAPSMLLGVNADGSVKTLPMGSPIPEGSLVLYGAETWDDAAAVAKKVDGNVVIVSFPPADGSNVSAAWMRGRDDLPVPQTTRVPGLLPATELVNLVSRPESYKWRPATELTAEQWIEKINDTRATQLIAFFCFVLIIVLWTLRSLAVESGGRLARLGIGMIPCAFVALFLAGNFAKATGLMPWNVLPFFTYFALLLGLLPVYLPMRALWPKSHPLFPVALIAALLLLWAEPLYTVFSNVLLPVPLPVSPLALGGLIAALTATVSLSLHGGIWPRLLAGACICLAMIVGVLSPQWWSVGQFLLILPAVVLLSGVGAMRVYLLPILVAWPFLFHSWNGHFAWDVNWLLNNFEDRNAINGAAIVQFLFSPTWLITLTLFVLATLCGGDFLRHQVRRAFATSNNSRALFWAALAIACMGLRKPYLLPSALVVLIAGFLVLLFDSAGTL